ncbi:MAG: DUF971 domain-containing protein [Deltaproteobacteria bacterium]|nr:DUF971 domain-containing protein [Deltaproteobacteria bacterium]
MQPQAINRVDAGIQIDWQDGHRSVYPAELLRRACPCAVCKEIPERVATGLLPLSSLLGQKIDILKAQPMGWYALQFTFTDRHETGIYAYEFLRQICPCEICRSAH